MCIHMPTGYVCQIFDFCEIPNLADKQSLGPNVISVSLIGYTAQFVFPTRIHLLFIYLPTRMGLVRCDLFDEQRLKSISFIGISCI